MCSPLLVAHDWKFAKGTIEDARLNLTRLQQDLTPFFYLEGELVHYLDVFWPRHKHDQTFTRMDRLIDDMSEQVIEDYVGRELIKNVTADDMRYLKSSQGNFSVFIKEEYY